MGNKDPKSIGSLMSSNPNEGGGEAAFRGYDIPVDKSVKKAPPQDIWIPHWVNAIPSKHLTPSAKTIYYTLLFRAGKKQVCWAGVRNIMAGTGIASMQTILNGLAQLERLRLIQIIPGGNNKANTYVVSHVKHVIDVKTAQFELKFDFLHIVNTLKSRNITNDQLDPAWVAYAREKLAKEGGTPSLKSYFKSA